MLFATGDDAKKVEPLYISEDEGTFLTPKNILIFLHDFVKRMFSM